VKAQRLFVFVIIVALLLTACTIPGTPQGTPPLDPDPLRIGVSFYPGWWTFYLADAKGFFEEAGVAVELVRYDDDYIASTEAFATKELDGVVETIGDAVIHAATGVPARVVLVTDYSAGADGFISNRQFGNPAELRGKRLGVGVGTFGHLFTLSVLEAYGLKESDVYFVNVNAEDVPTALEKGQIDGGHVWEPYLSMALADGDQNQLLFSSADTPGLIADVLVFHSRVLEERPEDVRRVLQAWQMALDFWENSPDEANAILTELTGASLDEIDQAQAGVNYFTLSDNVELFKPSTSLTSIYTCAQVNTDFYVAHGTITSGPDPEDYLVASFVSDLVE
jgi:NitT/TauT family transport system substrate-binding protein